MKRKLNRKAFGCDAATKEQVRLSIRANDRCRIREIDRKIREIDIRIATMKRIVSMIEQGDDEPVSTSG